MSKDYPVHHLVVIDDEGPIQGNKHVTKSKDSQGQPLVIGTGRKQNLACGFDHTKLGQGHVASDCPWVVNCEKCKKTKAFKDVDRPAPQLSPMEDMIDGSGG